MQWDVSVKAVVVSGDAVLLALNHRDEWELVGGRLEAGESTAAALIREVREEARLDIEVGAPVLADTVEVVPGRFVLVVAYACEVDGVTRTPAVSDEHHDVRFLPLRELDNIRMPDIYRRAIALAHPATPS